MSTLVHDDREPKLSSTKHDDREEVGRPMGNKRRQRERAADEEDIRENFERAQGVGSLREGPNFFTGENRRNLHGRGITK